MNFQEAFERGFAAVKTYVDRAVGDVTKRLAAVEAKEMPLAVTGAVIDREGQLVLTHSDGSTKSLGIVVGKDAKGQDGVDGLGFDDLDVTYDGERTIVLRFQRGDQSKEFAFSMPVVLDRGVWAEGKEYATGDAVTWAGSVWIAQKDGVAEKPDGGNGWRLAVKRGRDGKALRVDTSS